MGHGANDKLYITHAEHSGALGQHSASGGFKAKSDLLHPGLTTPFDCCALSLQPFNHPVCARNAGGTGTVFDLVNIIPWLKTHDNKHPKTNESLQPSSLIKLHYARNSSGVIHDPITFKPFNEHSHIVAIATTGNVFLAESVSKFAGGRDLLADIPFKKEDIITLQDPHNFSTPVPPAPTAASSSAPAMPVSTPTTKAPEKRKTTEESQVVAAPPQNKNLAKAAQPYNVSPYSTGATGASFTSTALDPMTKADVALFDEEELMYDDISRERKDKNRAKQRAYVRMVTNMGGSLNLELFCEKAPKTCYNFLMLARQGKYNDCAFHRLIPGFMIQGGDPTGTGRGGESYWGTPFRDEYDLKGAVKHTERGLVSMANKGFGTNTSQFFITFRATPHLDNKHTVFGKVVGGEDVLENMERVNVNPTNDKPVKPIKIIEVVIYQDPFEEYKKRLARKLERQQDPSSSNSANPNPKVAAALEDVTWLGTKLGSSNSKSTPSSAAANGEGGVGKYLKRSAPAAVGGGATASAGDEPGKKKRKLGFGDFGSW